MRWRIRCFPVIVSPLGILVFRYQLAHLAFPHSKAAPACLAPTHAGAGRRVGPGGGIRGDPGSSIRSASVAGSAPRAGPSLLHGGAVPG